MSKAAIIHEVQTLHKAVAFTFDDGPNPFYTPQVLDIFAEAKAKATFFMIGKQMLEHPDIVTAVSQKMHEIGNHTHTHPKLTQLSTEECLHEVGTTDKIIKEMTGSAPSLFRPPYLDFNDETASITDSLGYSMIGALNLGARDWEQPGVEHIVTTTRKHIRNGSILLFHDGFGDRSQTIEAVRLLVTELAAQGYQLVTVSELLRLANTK